MAEVNRAVVGHVELRSDPTNFFSRHAGSVSLCVDATWRGRGVGHALLRAALGHADDWMGLLRVELHVWPDNIAARRLYAGFGFEEEGVVRAHGLRQGVYADAILMSRLHPRPPVRRCRGLIYWTPVVQPADAVAEMRPATLKQVWLCHFAWPLGWE